MTKQDDIGHSSVRRVIRCLGRVTIIGSATLFILQMVVASSGIPQEWLEQWLYSVGTETEHQPRYVVVIGGSIPSEPGLMHTYYAAKVARGHTGITFIIAMPVGDDLKDSSAGRMRDELVLRGIPASHILFETKGVNTYQQAVFIGKMLGDDALAQPILIVTSPLHIRRTFLCFRKQGFTRIVCLPTHPTGERLDLGPWVFFRYTFWYRLQYQAMIARELTALAVYKLRGWI